MSVGRAIRLVSAVVVLGCVLGTYSVSQSSLSSWVSLDGSKAGTPADVVLSREESNASTSTFSIVLHGFYTERKDGPGGPYTKITVPGLGAVQQRGAPSLPALNVNVAVPTSAAAAKLRSATASEA